MSIGIKCVGSLLIITCIATITAFGNDAGEGGSLNGLLERSGVLTGVEPPVAARFREHIESAVRRLADEAKAADALEEGGELRELGIRLVESFLAADRPDIPFEGWAILIVGRSMPRDVVAEALARAIDKTKDPLAYSDSSHKLVRFVYAQDARHDKPDFAPMIARLEKATPEQRVKLIAHLLAYSPAEAFRPILETELKTVRDVSRLSRFDRALHEALWADAHGVKLDPEFTQAFRDGFNIAIASETWWVRLYAIELMARYSTLREAHYIKKLTLDPHSAVRSRAQSLKDVDSDTPTDRPVVR